MEKDGIGRDGLEVLGKTLGDEFMKKVIETVVELAREESELVDGDPIERRALQDTHPRGEVRGERKTSGFSEGPPVGF